MTKLPIQGLILLIIIIVVGLYFIIRPLITGKSTTDGQGWADRAKNPILYWSGIIIVFFITLLLFAVLVYAVLQYLS